MRVIQAYGREDVEIDRFARPQPHAVRAHMRSVRIQAWYLPVIEFAGLGTHRAGGRRRRLAGHRRHGHRRHGRLLRAVAVEPVRAGAAAVAAVQHGAVGRRRRCNKLYELLDTPVDVPERPTPSTSRPPATSWSTASRSPTPAASRCCATSTSCIAPGERLALVGPDRRRQVDAGQAHGPPLRPHRGPGHLRRRRPARRHAALAAAAHTRRAPGGLPVRRHDPRQRPHRPGRRHRRRGRRRPRRRSACSTASRRCPRASRPRCASGARACRRGSSSWCRWPAPRWPTRRCWCSTRRRRPSTPAPRRWSSAPSSG